MEVAIRGESYPGNLCANSIEWFQGRDPLPKLPPLQTLALSVLMDPSHASGSALIDAMIEAGLVDPEAEKVIRADERERAAVVCDSAADEWNKRFDEWMDRGSKGHADQCADRAMGARIIAGRLRTERPN